MLGCFHTRFSCLVRIRARLLPPPCACLCAHVFFCLFIVPNHGTFVKNGWSLAGFVFVLQNLNTERHIAHASVWQDCNAQFIQAEMRFKFDLLQCISHAYQESKWITHKYTVWPVHMSLIAARFCDLVRLRLHQNRTIPQSSLWKQRSHYSDKQNSDIKRTQVRTCTKSASVKAPC